MTSWLTPARTSSTKATIKSQRSIRGKVVRWRACRIDSRSMEERRPRVLAIDAGGTMTDTFVVDESGSFVVGKAQTTPDDESVGFMESARDALEQWDSSPEDAVGGVAAGLYNGTAERESPRLEFS